MNKAFQLQELVTSWSKFLLQVPTSCKQFLLHTLNIKENSVLTGQSYEILCGKKRKKCNQELIPAMNKQFRAILKHRSTYRAVWGWPQCSFPLLSTPPESSSNSPQTASKTVLMTCKLHSKSCPSIEHLLFWTLLLTNTTYWIAAVINQFHFGIHSLQLACIVNLATCSMCLTWRLHLPQEHIQVHWELQHLDRTSINQLLSISESKPIEFMLKQTQNFIRKSQHS